LAENPLKNPGKKFHITVGHPERLSENYFENSEVLRIKTSRTGPFDRANFDGSYKNYMY